VRSLAEAHLKRIRAVELLAAGHNYDEIAQAVGYTNRGSAHRAVSKALAEREIEGLDDRLDALHAAFWHQAMAGDIDAAKILLAISGQRRRLYGIDKRKPRREALYGGAVLVQPGLKAT
jgi:predicted metal-dependent HD superfamily phosphohydrolase